MDKKMSFQKEEGGGHPIIPKKELKCIWMTAGLISYKLCKYDLQCDRCPLDWELRNLSIGEFNNTTIESSEYSPKFIEGRKGEDPFKEDIFNIKEYLFYHLGHTWVKVEKADEVRIGIDLFLSKLLRGVKVIILPMPKRRVIHGKNFCSIIQEGGILNISFPISGIILSVNQNLKENPDLICKDPLGDGFLLTLKPKDFQQDQKHLFYGIETLLWCRKEWERFKEIVVSEIRLNQNQGKVGITMQNGGFTVEEVKKFIEPSKYIQLINNFLRKGEEFSSRPKNKIEVKS